jgi:DnaJ-class molecular chaperone
MGLKRENDQGNLIIHFDVVFPSRISTDTLTKLNDIFNEEFQDVHKEKEITEKI